MAAIKDNTYEIDTVLEWHLTDMNKITCIMIMASCKVQNIVQLLFSEKNLISLQCTAKYFDN